MSYSRSAQLYFEIEETLYARLLEIRCQIRVIQMNICYPIRGPPSLLPHNNRKKQFNSSKRTALCSALLFYGDKNAKNR
jgi:hypothetical protein